MCFVLQPSNIFLFIFINIFRFAAFQYFFLVRRSDKDRRLWACHRPHSGGGGRVLQRLQPIPQTHRPSGDHSLYESRTSTATVNTHTHVPSYCRQELTFDLGLFFTLGIHVYIGERDRDQNWACLSFMAPRPMHMQTNAIRFLLMKNLNIYSKLIFIYNKMNAHVYSIWIYIYV